MNKQFDLSGKVSVVTGGAGLLGSAFVSALASAGSAVVIADKNVAKALKIMKELKVNQFDVNVEELDLCDFGSISRCVQHIKKIYSTIDVWVNNAYPKTDDWNLSFENIPAESWRKNTDSHLNGYCFCCQEVAKVMKEQKNGSIVNIASIYGMGGPDFSVYEGTTMTMPAPYAAIKGGLINFTRYLASYCGPDQVRVNTVSPGGVKNGQPKSFIRKYEARTPLRRMARPEDICGAIVFLASDESSYITGQNLAVDGGWTAI